MKVPIPAHFGRYEGIFSRMTSPIVLTPQTAPPCAKARRLSHKAWKSFQGFDLRAWPRRKEMTVY